MNYNCTSYDVEDQPSTVPCSQGTWLIKQLHGLIKVENWFGIRVNIKSLKYVGKQTLTLAIFWYECKEKREKRVQKFNKGEKEYILHFNTYWSTRFSSVNTLVHLHKLEMLLRVVETVGVALQAHAGTVC